MAYNPSYLKGEDVASIDYILNGVLEVLHPGCLEGDWELGSAARRNDLKTM